MATHVISRPWRRFMVNDISSPNTGTFYIVPPTPPDGNNMILCHFDGTAGTTVFVDSSMNALSGTMAAGAYITGSSPKFGAGAMYNPVDDGYCKISSSKLDVTSSGDFTYEYWYKSSTNTWHFQQMYGNGWPLSAQSGWVIIHTNSPEGLYFYFTSVVNVGANCSVSDGNWHHIALVRSGSAANNCKLYLDGSKLAQATFTGQITASGGYLSMNGAAYAPNYSPIGYFDEVRMSNVARYSGDSFTVPTAAFSN